MRPQDESSSTGQADKRSYIGITTDSRAARFAEVLLYSIPACSYVARSPQQRKSRMSVTTCHRSND